MDIEFAFPDDVPSNKKINCKEVKPKSKNNEKVYGRRIKEDKSLQNPQGKKVQHFSNSESETGAAVDTIDSSFVPLLDEHHPWSYGVKEANSDPKYLCESKFGSLDLSLCRLSTGDDDEAEEIDFGTFRGENFHDNDSVLIDVVDRKLQGKEVVCPDVTLCVTLEQVNGNPEMEKTSGTATTSNYGEKNRYFKFGNHDLKKNTPDKKEDTVFPTPNNILPECLNVGKKRAFDGDRQDVKQILEKEEYLESKRIVNQIIGPSSSQEKCENIPAFLSNLTGTGRQRLERTRYIWRSKQADKKK